MKKMKLFGKRLSEIHAIIIGVLAAVIAMLLLLVTSTICIYNEYFDLEIFSKTSPVILYLCSLLGVYLGGKCEDNSKEKVCILVGVVFAILQLCGSLLLFDGVTGGVWVNIIATVGAIISGVFLNKNKKNRGNKRSTTKRHR